MDRIPVHLHPLNRQGILSIEGDIAGPTVLPLAGADQVITDVMETSEAFLKELASRE